MAALLAIIKKLWCIKKYLVLVCTPLVLAPLLLALPPKEGKCLYVVLLMATYWCTEALPLSVTALLPIVLFPLMGILPSNKVCPQYFLDTNFLFLSGLIMASVIEEWNLHRRIALKVLLIVGVQPTRLILGMMITCAFLSMWLSNTASTAMMLPIATAILKSLFGDKDKDAEAMVSSEETGGVNEKSIEAINNAPAISWEPGIGIHTGEKLVLYAAAHEDVSYPIPAEMQHLSRSTEKDAVGKMEVMLNSQSQTENKYRTNIWKGFLISIPYAASIGGTATLTGTAPNLILIGQLKSYFPGCDVVNFGSWFVFAFPLMLIFLFFGWLWICLLYGAIRIRCSKKEKSELRSGAESRARSVIQEDYNKLGPIKFAEKAVLVFFFLFAILLFTRDPKFIPGWSSLFKPGFTSDAVTGIAIVVMLFFFPCQKPSLRWWFDLKAPNTESRPLLTWKKAQESVPWNIILLLGGGFAMAKGCEESGLPAWIGSHLQPLDNIPPAAAVLLVTVLIASFTEFASNTATIIVFLPILAELALRLRVNPLYLMIPGTVGCSYAFMLPVSTPPNSIAFSTGHLMVKDMARTGLVMNLMGVLLLSLAVNTWGVGLFQLNQIPSWVTFDNNTSVTSEIQNITSIPLNTKI